MILKNKAKLKLWKDVNNKKCDFWSHCAIFTWKVKFIYSEKATKFCEISTLLLSACTVDKRKVEISQNFVTFSDYTNFIKNIFCNVWPLCKNEPCSKCTDWNVTTLITWISLPHNFTKQMQSALFGIKVQFFWEDHKIWLNLPYVLTLT